MSSLGSHDYQAARKTEITATGNIDDLDPLGSGLIIMNNATLATIRGIKAGYQGKTITIISNDAGQVNLAHDNVNSLAPNRLFNFITSGVTPLAAGKGTATYQYTGNNWELVTHNQGAWIDVPYDASNFTADGSMIWTVEAGDVLAYKFIIVNNTISMIYEIQNTSISGTLNLALRIRIPGGCVSNTRITDLTRIFNAGVVAIGIVFVVPGEGFIRIYNDIAGGTNWSAATNSTHAYGYIVFGVQ